MLPELSCQNNVESIREVGDFNSDFLSKKLKILLKKKKNNFYQRLLLRSTSAVKAESNLKEKNPCVKCKMPNSQSKSSTAGVFVEFERGFRFWPPSTFEDRAKVTFKEKNEAAVGTFSENCLESEFKTINPGMPVC